MYGNATVWDDLFFPFTTGNSGGNPYPTFDNDSMYWNFVVDTTGPTICKQFFSVQFPHRAKEGTITISPHIHYKHETAVGTPTFIVKYKWYNIGETTQTAYKWLKIGTTTGTTDKTHQIVNGADITYSGRTLSSIFICQVYLFSQTGTGNVHAYQFDIHFAIDAMGSKSEYIK